MGTYVTIGSQLRFACHAKCITHSRSTDLSENLSDRCQLRILQIGRVTHDGYKRTSWRFLQQDILQDHDRRPFHCTSLNGRLLTELYSLT